eukprot:164125_1
MSLSKPKWKEFTKFYDQKEHGHGQLFTAPLLKKENGFLKPYTLDQIKSDPIAKSLLAIKKFDEKILQDKSSKNRNQKQAQTEYFNDYNDNSERAAGYGANLDHYYGYKAYNSHQLIDHESYGYDAYNVANSIETTHIALFFALGIILFINTCLMCLCGGFVGYILKSIHQSSNTQNNKYHGDQIQVIEQIE